MKENKWEEKFLLYQQNIYPAMIECLAEDLGVTVESIKRLGVGFLPGEQAWIFAERNADGHIIGLLRRYANGKKFIIEGGKRGLIYECTGTREKGRSSPTGRFVRVYNANVECPLCRKKDWCMVSDDNPSLPSAVICGRTSEGATKFIEGSGYLHHLKKSGNIIRSILPDTDKPVVVVEGASDVLAAMDMGYVAVGKPSAEGGNDLLVSLLNHRSIVVIGENDEAGKRGLEATFQTLKPKCPSVIKVFPPDGFKDLREWHPTAEEFERHYKQTGKKETDISYFDTKDFYPLAQKWLGTQTKNGQRLLHYYRNNWFNFTNSQYKRLPVELLERRLYEYFGNKEVFNPKYKEIRTLNANEYFIRNIKHILSRICLIDGLQEKQEPFYLNSTKQLDVTQAVVFRNGILHINTGTLEPLSPNIFITKTLPYDYNPNAKCDLWLGFIYDVLNGDEECVKLLQEWFGYNLIASNHLEQMFFIFGIPNSGKSTITDVLYALLGSENCEAINIENLGDQFGLQTAVGKLALIISEDRTIRRMETDKILQRIKRITGQDWLPVSQKFKEALQVKPIWRITYSGNDFLSFNDESQALSRRTNLLYLSNDYSENPDRQLKQKLIKEIQGIAIWALEGLRRLLKQGKFTVPEASKEHTKEFQRFTNHLAAMIDECCVIYREPAEAIQHWTPINYFFELHKVWYQENNVPSLGKIAFGMKFRNAFPYLKKSTRSWQGHQIRVFEGIEILPEVMRQYLGGIK